MLLRDFQMSSSFVPGEQLVARDVKGIYKKVQQVGKGSFGQVFKAIRTNAADRFFALKKIQSTHCLEGVSLKGASFGNQ